MKIRIAVGVLTLGAALSWWSTVRRPVSAASNSRPPRPASSLSRVTPAPNVLGSSTTVSSGAGVTETAIDGEAQPARATLRPTAARFWSQPIPEGEFARFRDWTQRYLAAPDEAARRALEAEGIALAQARREDLQGIIRSDPRRALELTVPLSVRRALPASVNEQLEVRLDGRGDLAVLAALAEPGREAEVTPLYRTATLGDRTYRASVYGRREGEPSRSNIPLHGIAVDEWAALDENPVRWLEEGEAGLRALNSEPICAVSQAPVTVDDQEFLDVGGLVAVVCSPVHGEELNSNLITAEAGGGSSGTGSSITPQSAATEGIKKLIMIRCDFSDLAGVPLSDSRAATIVSNLNVFYATMSYGKTGFKLIGDGSLVTPTVRLPKTAAVYGASDASVLRTDARAAVRAIGIEPRDYDYDLTCFGSVPGFGWAGLGFVGQPGAWIRASFDEAGGVCAHELGHNFGLNHANFWDTGDTSTLGAGTSVEYGDGFDTMGNAGAGKRHFNARYKNLLNWLPNTGIAAFTTNGTYRIVAHDEPTATGFRALRITKNPNTNYWVEFRQRYTNNVWLMNGVGLRWARSGSGNQSTLLLDTTPGTADGKNDSAIVIGRTFSDRVAGVHITPVAFGGTTPESIDVVVNRGTFPSNHPPSVTIAASTATAAVNGTVTFTATAQDADGDTLAYYWEFDDSTFGRNEPSASKKWSTAGEYVVRCTVSDMKGGSTSDSVVVRVGSPTTVRIAGKVLREGQPVPGVRVYTSNTKSSWTDGDGNYVLAGLAKGSYTVRAAAEGLLFTRHGFSNPLSVSASRTNIDFDASLPGDLVNVSLIPAGAVWRYRDDGVNLGTTWRSRTYDDSTWDRGGAQLGYGDDDVLTILDFGPNASNKYITYYFRHWFDVADTSGMISLVLGVVRDDGAVVYLNGKEIFRSNMPTGTISATTLASSNVGGADESTYFETDLDPALLLKGTNLMAVEVHQDAVTSSDISFNLQLAGLRARPLVAPDLSFEVADGQLRIRWSGGATAVLQAANRPEVDADWQVPADATTTEEGTVHIARIPLDGEQRYFRLVLP